MVAAPVSKSQGDDADEPYSPGGSSDEDMPLLPVKMLSSSDQMQTSEDELKRKMEEINRQIAAQEMEIAGLLTGEPTVMLNIIFHYFHITHICKCTYFYRHLVQQALPLRTCWPISQYLQICLRSWLA